MTDVLLATCSALPAGEWGSEILDEALAARGIEAQWVVWDDPDADWSAGLTAVRATWDYETRREEFLAWAQSLPRVLNGARAFAWNTDKAYLAELAAVGVSVVPTVLVQDEYDLPAALAEVSGEDLRAVVKPRVAAGGRGLVVFDGEPGGVADLDEAELGPGPWVVQPLVDSIRTEGETSVFVLDGVAVSQAVKLPREGEIRVHEEYGGRTDPTDLTEEAVALAREVVDAAQLLLGTTLDYARVDMMRLADGRMALGELEVTEPGLYLDALPGNADAFADLVASRLRR